MHTNKRGALAAFVLAVLLAFTMMSGFGCTPNDDEEANPNDVPQQEQVADTGGFVLEDTATVEVQIED